jgi:hypothetical protein
MLGPPMGWPFWNPGKHCVNFSHIWIIFKHSVNARWSTVCPLLLPWVGSKSQESWVLIGFACNVMFNQGIKSLILWGWCFSSGTLEWNTEDAIPEPLIPARHFCSLPLMLIVHLQLHLLALSPTGAETMWQLCGAQRCLGHLQSSPWDYHPSQSL